MGAFAACGENIFIQTTASKVEDLASTNAASKAWYAGEAEYDIEKGSAKSPNDKDKSAAALRFTQMVWRGTSTVGFGVKDKWVIAWYCNSAGNNGGP
jgi:hypothetical protein